MPCLRALFPTAIPIVIWCIFLARVLKYPKAPSMQLSYFTASSIGSSRTYLALFGVPSMEGMHRPQRTDMARNLWDWQLACGEFSWQVGKHGVLFFYHFSQAVHVPLITRLEHDS